MEYVSQVNPLGESQGVGNLDPTAALIGGLGGALARLNGGQTPGQGQPGAGADGFSPNGDLAGNAQAASMNPLLAGLASWGQDQKIQQEANQVLQAKGIDTGGGAPQQPQGGQQQDVGALVQQLQQDYQKAKQGHVNLTQSTEQAVQKALEGEQQPQDQQQDAGGGADGAGDAGGGGGCQNCQGGGGPQGSQGAGQSGSTDAPQAISQDAKSGNMTENASKLLDSALQGDKDFDNVFGQFGQGTEGNCAAVACIKSAMDVYDNKIFDSVQKGDDGSYTIKMQDGKEVKVSAAELGQAAKASNFDGPDSEAKSYAIMSYAAMAKRAEMEGHEGSRNYTQALNSLANGDNPYDSARFLGLQNQVQRVDPQHAQGGNAVVAWNSNHAVYIDSTSSGTKTDHYGQSYGYDGTDTRGGKLTSGFTFKPRESSSSTSTSHSSVPSAGSSSSSHSSTHRSSSSSTSSSRSTSSSSRSSHS